MLGDKNALVTIAVKDANAAAKFYEGTLGLKRSGMEGDDARVYRSGSAQVLVYQSQYAGTNKATAATWVVGNDMEKVVGALKAKGVTFEHYTIPNTTLQGDVHVMGDFKAAWFKDPAGNILALVSR